jgi:hypothetical protein
MSQGNLKVNKIAIIDQVLSEYSLTAQLKKRIHDNAIESILLSEITERCINEQCKINYKNWSEGKITDNVSEHYPEHEKSSNLSISDDELINEYVANDISSQITGIDEKPKILSLLKAKRGRPKKNPIIQT